MQNIDFLGHTFSSEGLSVHPDKCAAVHLWPEPTNVSELHSLLGTFGFWRAFIAKYADIPEPLTRLTCKNVAWRWGEEHTCVRQRLKAAVKQAPVLHPPDICKPLWLQMLLTMAVVPVWSKRALHNSGTLLRFSHISSTLPRGGILFMNGNYWP